MTKYDEYEGETTMPIHTTVKARNRIADAAKQYRINMEDVGVAIEHFILTGIDVLYPPKSETRRKRPPRS